MEDAPPPWVLDDHHDATDADLHVSELQDERETCRRSRKAADRATGAPQRTAGRVEGAGAERETWGPPEDERSARFWVCPKCKRVGYDPNRRQP